MNTELYFPRSGSSFAKTTESSFDTVVRKLSGMDINIIYKTEINLTASGIADALKESIGGSDKIELILIADALDSTDQSAAEKLLDGLEIHGRIRKLDYTVTKQKDNDKSSEDYMPVPALRIESGNTEEIDISKADDTPSEINIVAYAVDQDNHMIVLLPKEEAAGCEFGEILQTVCAGIIKPKQKNSFWKRFIPCSGDSPFDVVRKVILLLAICTFIVSSCMLINILVLEPAKNDQTTESIRSLLVSTDESAEGAVTRKPIDGSQGPLDEFKNLLAENKDTIGWIKVPNTIIDHVVVKPPKNEDPEYYLHRDFYGNYSKYGTVFMDYRSELDSKNIIIHGHHMQDGRMFANLKHYEDLDFYKSAPTFTFNTIYEKNQWKIISIFKTNTLDYQGTFFNYLRGNFDNEYDFLNYIYQLRVRSMIDCPVDVNENDSIVTLSTCSYDFEEFRLVIVARKLRDGESADVDVSKAKENPTPLYPDIWYNTYGGSKPDVSSFQEAYNNGKITWYDGKKESWTPKDDQELEKTLAEGKKKAIDLMGAYISRRKYSETDTKAINSLYKQYIDLINAATSGQQINDLYHNAISDFDTYKTISEIEESSKKELQDAISTAKTEIHNSVAGNVYRMTQLTEVNKLFDTYNKKLDDAKTLDEVESIKKDGIAALAKVKTKEEVEKEESEKAEESSRKAEESKKAAEEAKKAEEEALRQAEAERLAAELEAARKDALRRINASFNPTDYLEPQQGEINNIINDYKDRINSASDIDSVSSLADQAISDISMVKTKAEMEPEESPEPESSIDESSEPEEPETPENDESSTEETPD